jgi:hypothetical protein
MVSVFTGRDMLTLSEQIEGFNTSRGPTLCGVCFIAWDIGLSSFSQDTFIGVHAGGQQIHSSDIILVQGDLESVPKHVHRFFASIVESA